MRRYRLARRTTGELPDSRLENGQWISRASSGKQVVHSDPAAAERISQSLAQMLGCSKGSDTVPWDSPLCTEFLVLPLSDRLCFLPLGGPSQQPAGRRDSLLSPTPGTSQADQ